MKRRAKQICALLLAGVMTTGLIHSDTSNLAAAADFGQAQPATAQGPVHPAQVESAGEPSQYQAASPAFRAEKKRKGKRRRSKRAKRRRISRSYTLSWDQLAKRYPGAFLTAGPRKVRRVALTFDDVPDPRYTPKILDVLARNRARATFFVVGSRASAYPAMVWRMKREGHAIGNHSYNHAVFSRVSLPAFQNQIRRTDGILYRILGYSPRFVRPPYGEIIPRQVEWLRASGYVVVNWDVDSVDWKSIDSGSIMTNIRKTLQPGSIILQHAGGGEGQDLSGTVQALPKLIRLLRSKGYELVTVPELLGRPEWRPR